MKTLKALLSQLDSADIGLLFIAAGIALYDLRLALIVVGVVMVLEKRPFRSWF